jgi:hypothetical protein
MLSVIRPVKTPLLSMLRFTVVRVIPSRARR